MKRAPLLLTMAALAVSASGGVVTPDFRKDILPLLETYCLGCHDAEAKGGVNLEPLCADGAFWQEPKTWEKTLNTIRDASMPPAKKAQPQAEERALLTAWLSETLENPDPTQIPIDVGRNLIRRLSRIEYNNTVRDLLGVDSRPADRFPPDGGGGGGFDDNASTLFVPPILLEKYLEAAAEIVAAAAPERIFRIRPGGGKDERTAACENLAWFVERAWRRPAGDEELKDLFGLYENGRAGGVSWEDAMRDVIRAVLVSPSFVFRLEQDRVGLGPQPVNAWELASRLSYFLWSTMPDETLFELARDGRLLEPTVLEAQVRRMLKDERARALSENFASQWLRTRELHTSVRPAREKFPDYTPELRDAMAAEPVEFFHALLSTDRPLTHCLDSDYTFANDVLARFYGLDGVEGSGFRQVSLTDRNRGGVIGMAGVLTLTSYPRRTSPVLRGKWVMEEILGSPPPPPPPMIKSLPTAETSRSGRSLRQQLELHRSKAECAACHKTMDQLGFGLENFDPIGKWRTDVAGTTVDSAGELPDGRKFSGPFELRQLLLARKDEFVRNIAERMFSYAVGRGVEQTDWLTIRQIAKAVTEDEYRTQRLVLAIVQSAPFQFRKPADPIETASTP